MTRASIAIRNLPNVLDGLPSHAAEPVPGRREAPIRVRRPGNDESDRDQIVPSNRRLRIVTTWPQDCPPARNSARTSPKFLHALLESQTYAVGAAFCRGDASGQPPAVESHPTLPQAVSFVDGCGEGRCQRRWGNKVADEVLLVGKATHQRPLAAQAAVCCGNTKMRMIAHATLGLTVAALLFQAAPVSAQEYPWCSQTGEGGTNCSFVSEEQCRMSARWCQRNLLYQPPKQAPTSTRRTRAGR
jgi:hypothetical protein